MLHGMNEHLRIRNRSRDWLNLILRRIYIVLFRSTYVVVWFYFLPIFMMILQFVVSNNSIAQEDSASNES
jgi:hypothetical protein